MNPLLIALDADGVLLDYNRQFGIVWERHFQEPLVCAEPRAYHARNYWGITPPDEGHAFWDFFDQGGWHDMPAMPGALEACHRLAGAGHTLVCVSSMPSHRQPERLTNLRALGFPIEEVIATGRTADRTANPKLAAIQALRPAWFVDDSLRKLRGLDGVQCVLVDPDHPDSPNTDQDQAFLAMRVGSLAEFADRFLALTR